MLKQFAQRLFYAPDERGQGDSTAVNTAPSKVEVDGEEVDVGILQDTYRKHRDFERANHERATTLKRERETFETDRRAFQQMQEAQKGERGEFLRTLQSLQPKPAEPTQTDTRPSFQDIIKEGKLDLVGDEEAPAKLGRLFDQVRAEDEARIERRLRAEFYQQQAGLKQELSQQTQTTNANWQRQTTREKAREDAEIANRETFDRRLRTEHSEVLDQLDEEGRQAVYAKMRSLIDGQYGQLDPQSQWRWNERAVDDALWMAEPSRRVLLARETAAARGDGLRARVNGEGASRVTPTRANRRAGANGEDTLRERFEETKALLMSRQITPDEALKRFSAEEQKRLLGRGAKSP